jgi:trimeric autotransporter adhesin
MADRYWVGGTDNWNATAGAKWALTSGGAGGEAVPTINDDVYIDSGSGANTVTVTATATCKSLNFVSGAGSFSGTFAGSSATSCSTNLVVSGSMTWSYTGTISFTGTTTGNTITANGTTLASSLTFNGVGGSWALQDALTTNATRSVVLTNGTLDLNNKNLTCGFFASSNSNTRTLAYGTGQIYLTGSAASIYSAATATGLTITGTPIVNCTYSGSTGTRSINGGSAVSYTTLKTAFNITAGTDTVNLGGTNVFGNVDFTGFTGTYGFTATDPQFFGDLTFDAGMIGPSSATRSLQFMATSGTQTITSNGVTIDSGITCEGGATYTFADALTQGAAQPFTFSLGTVKLKNGVTSTVGAFATTGTTQKFLESTLAGSQATLSQASGTVNAQYLDAKDVAATGGAVWNLVNESVNRGNLSGWYVAHQQNAYLPGGMF